MGYKLDDMYSSLRNGQLERKHTSADGAHLLGVLMETGFPSHVVTLAFFRDGTVSMYSSSGGSLLGYGGDNDIGNAARELIGLLDQKIQGFKRVSKFPFPKNGEAMFYLLTPEGVLTGKAKIKELEEKRSGLSGAYAAINALFSQVWKKAEGERAAAHAPRSPSSASGS